jgi:septal ring factor EnvC (AmiA/AmiB activator)
MIFTIAWDYAMAALGAVVGFFRKRPMAILYTVLVVGTLLAWRHYDGLVEDLEQVEQKAAGLERDLTDQKQATDAAVTRAEEIKTDYNDLARVIQQLQADGDEIRTENSRLKRRIDGLRLEALVAEQPGLASVVASTEYNASQRLLECETTPGGPRPCSPAGATE